MLQPAGVPAEVGSRSEVPACSVGIGLAVIELRVSDYGYQSVGYPSYCQSEPEPPRLP